METSGLVVATLGSGLFIFGDFEGWPLPWLVAILAVSAFLVGMLVAQYRWQMASLLIASVMIGEWVVKELRPFPSAIGYAFPNSFVVFAFAVIIVGVTCTVGGVFHDMLSQERPNTR